ncbi:MAG: mechanosensitive ion channel [Gammaproteobacteria bacterium]|nr:mechanosensitive ion channel [Gammaproteobacteria bacterium]MCP4090977.1 mechanosensitive ion channel [Gammaproteobacteria bacterium]MCP4277497.1 mechanosensitive ion channel [Gammaproteobacteria bacterium]MCP4831106.1 mechanosensitive ion channel [Gammaproteobacteria bacterium]MCP4928530.1 mechanosensitive ion channel [Gammaproteobacteria bacterium]
MLESMFTQLATMNPLLPAFVGNALLALSAFIAYVLTKHILLFVLHHYAKRSKAKWDDALVKQNVFGRMSQLVPALVIQQGIYLVPNWPITAELALQNVIKAFMIIMIVLTITALLAAINQIYENQPDAGNRPIKGFIQLGQIIIFVIGLILVIAALIDKSPVILLSGLGAITAVLLIVFKDTLLSLVASIQLTGQGLIRVGDWIEVPQYGADGDVIDVALYSITVQNWDKTISTIPTYQLVSGSFKNWRGMNEAGGRRIKRFINIDLNSIRLLTNTEQLRFSKFALLKDYIAEKQSDLEAYNAALDSPGESDINLRRLTNIGTFRAYIYNYLKNHPKIHNDMTLIVRQLQSGNDGVPIEAYCFCNDTNWFNYEGIQSDIFDHLFAIAPEFDLHVYQNPTGMDVQKLLKK